MLFNAIYFLSISYSVQIHFLYIMHQNMNTYPHRINVNPLCLESFNQVLHANATEIINHYMSRCSILVSTSTEESCDSIEQCVK